MKVNSLNGTARADLVPRPLVAPFRARRRVAGLVLCLGVLTLVGGLTLTACTKPEEAVVEAKPALRKPALDQELNARLIEFKTQLQKDAFSASARLGMGQVFVDMADLRAAETEFTRALELGMDPNIVLPVLARTWNLLGRSQALIDAHANTKLSNATAMAELDAALAAAYAALGDAPKARALAVAALASDPQSEHARVLSAQVAMADGRTDQALRILQETLARHPKSALAWKAQADIYLMAKNDSAAAVSAYEQALSAEPRHMATHATLIALALGSGDLATAQSRLDRLAAVAPGFAQTMYFEARIAAAKGDVATAREIVQRALVTYPKDLRSTMLAAEIELQAGALRTAEDYLGQALTQAPRVPKVRHLLAQTYLRTDAPEKALMILEPLVRAKRGDATALSLSAEASLQMGLTHKATQLYERASAADPANPKIRTALAMSRIAKGDTAGGFSDLEQAAASDPTAYADMALLSARLKNGELPAAIKTAEVVIKKRPKSPVPQWLLGRLKLRMNDKVAARGAFERALELDRSFVPAAVALATLDLDAKDAAKARSRFEGVLALNPAHLDAQLALAEIQARSGEAESAVAAAFENVAQAHADQSRAWLALINHYIDVGNAPAALLKAQNATAALPDDLAIADALGRAQMSAGESAQALATFRKIISARPRSYAAHLRMADVYLGRNEIESAMESLKLALTLQPELIEAQVKLAGLATVKKNWPEALAIARKVQKLSPKLPQGYHLEGLVYAAQREWEPALSAFKSAMQRAESSELALRLHGAMLAAGKKDEAARMAAQWVAKHPKDNNFIGYLGDQAMLDNDLVAAEARYRAILQTDDRNVDAMNNLAWILTQQSKPGAVAMARRAAELQPSRADVLDTLSMALAGENQLPAALANQRKAVELAPKMPLLRLHLSQLAIKNKEFALARAELDTLSALGKAFPEQAEVWQLRQKLP